MEIMGFETGISGLLLFADGLLLDDRLEIDSIVIPIRYQCIRKEAN